MGTKIFKVFLCRSYPNIKRSYLKNNSLKWGVPYILNTENNTKKVAQDSHQQVIQNSCNKMKIKARILRPLVVGFKFCKKTDINIIISINDNIQISNKSTANRKWRCHYLTRVDVQTGIAYICFENKNSVTMHRHNGYIPS